MNQRGFTIVELLIAMVISLVVLGALIGTYLMQSGKYNREELMVEMRENGRAGIDMVTREILNAGYNPSGSAVAGIKEADVDTVRFTMDLDGDGAISGSNEDVTYALDATDLQLTRNGHPVAENITEVIFTYYDSLNNPLTSTPLSETDLAKVRRIDVKLTARTAKPISSIAADDIGGDGTGVKVMLADAQEKFLNLLDMSLQPSAAIAAGQSEYKTKKFKSSTTPENLKEPSDATTPGGSGGGGDDDDEGDDDEDASMYRSSEKILLADVLEGLWNPITDALQPSSAFAAEYKTKTFKSSATPENLKETSDAKPPGGGGGGGDDDDDDDDDS